MEEKMKNFKILFFGWAVLFLSGCASLNSNVPFQYQPSLSAGKQISKTVGFNMLKDTRPEKDRAYTKSIKDIEEKITSKLIEDFRSSRVFLSVHYPPIESDDFIIDGTIDRFKWKLYAKPISYVPYLGLIVFLGVPSSEAYGMAEINLEIRDRSGASVGKFRGHSEIRNVYTVYNFKAGEAGAELAEAFRSTSKQLKGEIALRVQ